MISSKVTSTMSYLISQQPEAQPVKYKFTCEKLSNVDVRILGGLDYFKRTSSPHKKIFSLSLLVYCIFKNVTIIMCFITAHPKTLHYRNK